MALAFNGVQTTGSWARLKGDKRMVATHITYAMWVRVPIPVVGQDYGRIWSVGDYGANGWGVDLERYAGNNTFHFAQFGPSSYSYVVGSQGNVAPTNGVWFHACWRSLGRWDHKVFKDGVSLGTSSVERIQYDYPEFLASSAPVYPLPAGPIKCSISHLGIWQRGLTDTEVLRLARGMHPLRLLKTGMIHYAEMRREERDPISGRVIYPGNGPTEDSPPPVERAPGGLFVSAGIGTRTARLMYAGGR